MPQLKTLNFSLALILTMNVHATEPSIESTASDEQRRQQRANDNENKRRIQKPQSAKPIEISAATSKLPAAGGPCFKIKNTQLTYNKKLISPPRDINRLNGTCANIRAIASLLNDANKYYQDIGLITTRAYVPKQNLKQGILSIKIVAGTLQQLRYADKKSDSKQAYNKPESDRRLDSAFPMSNGDVISLRSLEQGLDNFNLPRSQSGKFKLEPGASLGQTDVVVNAKNKKPWEVKLKINDSGYDSTGKHKAAIDFSYDNLFGINDSLTLGVNSNIHDENDSKHSLSNSVRYSFPYKNWAVSLTASQTDFARVIQGVNQEFKVDGDSENVSIGLERLISRDKSKKIYGFGSLTKKESHNYIEGFEIETQKRKLSILNLGLRGEKNYPDQSKLEWRLSNKLATSLFDAMDDIPGPAEGDFNATQVNLTYSQPLSSGRFKYKGELAAQYADKELPGSEQFGAGGRYDVRGFYKDSLYGNTGIYLKNTLEAKPIQPSILNKKVTLTPYTGLDFGMVEEPAVASWDKPQIAGIAAGIKVDIGKHISSEATYSQALVRPTEFKDDKSHWYLNLTVKH